MRSTVTFRLDPETARILQDLTRLSNGSRSKAIKEALRARWEGLTEQSRPTSWEIYSRLYSKLEPPRPAGPRRDRAREVAKRVKEKLFAKRRAGTL